MPEPATIYKLAQEYLADLRKGEMQAVRLLERRYASIWRTIAKESAAILKMSDDAGALPGWRQGQLDRYNSLIAQVRDELVKLGRDAEHEVADLQREAIRLGFDLSKDQLRALGVTASFDMLPAAATQQMVGFLSDGTPLNALLRTLGEASAQRVGNTLSQAIALGWGPRKTAEKLRRETGLSLTRAMRIARTEQLRAFRTSTIEGYRQSGVVTGYRRMSARNPNTCIACLLKDGEFYELRSDFTDHPNGRCTVVPVINEDYGVNVEWESGRTWFGKQDDATQRKILGNGVYDAWKRKEIALEDMAHLRQNAQWGDSWQAASLQRAKLQAQARRAGLAPVIEEIPAATGQTTQGQTLMPTATNKAPSFRNVKEAEEWGVKNGVAGEIKLPRGADLDGVREMYDAVLETNQRFNASPLSYMGSRSGIPERIRFTNSGRVVAGYVKQIDALIISNESTSSARLAANIIESRETMASTAPIDKLKRLVQTKEQYAPIRDVVEGMSERRWSTLEKPADAIYHELGHRMNESGSMPRSVYEAIHRDGYHLVVSEYAKVDQSEFFAEAFSSYMKGEYKRLHPDFVDWIKQIERYKAAKR